MGQSDEMAKLFELQSKPFNLFGFVGVIGESSAIYAFLHSIWGLGAEIAGHMLNVLKPLMYIEVVDAGDTTLPFLLGLVECIELVESGLQFFIVLLCEFASSRIQGLLPELGLSISSCIGKETPYVVGVALVFLLMFGPVSLDLFFEEFHIRLEVFWYLI